jgi:hypothetical protein
MDASGIPEMTRAYLTAALFTADESDIPPKSGPFDATPHWHRLAASTLDKAAKVCTWFYRNNAADLTTYAADDAGHDLWFTRTRAGVGFWEADHCTDEEGERLTDAAHRLGERSLIVGDDGRFHIE